MNRADLLNMRHWRRTGLPPVASIPGTASSLTADPAVTAPWERMASTGEMAAIREATS